MTDSDNEMPVRKGGEAEVTIAELKQMIIWLCWRGEVRDNKQTKVPCAFQLAPRRTMPSAGQHSMKQSPLVSSTVMMAWAS